MPTAAERLAELDRRLASLRAEYDAAMSSFRFERAAGAQTRIAALEAERAELALTLPPPAPPMPPAPPPTIPRRLLRRR